MIKSSLARRAGSPLTVISAILMSGFVLSSCTTTDHYTRQACLNSQACLNKGLAPEASTFDDCVAEQKSLIPLEYPLDQQPNGHTIHRNRLDFFRTCRCSWPHENSYPARSIRSRMHISPEPSDRCGCITSTCDPLVHVGRTLMYEPYADADASLHFELHHEAESTCHPSQDDFGHRPERRSPCRLRHG